MRSNPTISRPLAAALLVAGGLVSSTTAQEPRPVPRDPLPIEREERVEVRLVLIDAVVLDRANRTVGDLNAEDFEILVDGTPLPIDTLDARCADGGADDPRGVRKPQRRAAIPADDERRIVLLLDYQHLSQIERVDVLERTRAMVRHGATERDRILVAALDGGLRIEQTFTNDRQRVLDTLERMEYDITLWSPAFNHLTETGFFLGLRALLDVLAFEPGDKGIVLFSNSPAPADENDPEFADLAAAAGVARAAIYPVHAAGLTDLRPG